MLPKINSESKKKIKIFLFFLVYYTGILHILILFLSMRKRKHHAVILFYHRFKENGGNEILFKTDKKTFERQISHIKRWYNVVALDQLIHHLNRKLEFEKPTIVITIDDGFKDNFDIAFPVLKKYGLPCIIFLTSGFISTNKGPWIDELGEALAETNMKELYLEDLFGEKPLDISTEVKKRRAMHEIYLKLLYLEHHERKGHVNQILKLLHVNRKNQKNKRIMLSWEEIFEMKKEGIFFGAHTVSHPTLSRMNSDQARSEIIHSKRQIEEMIDVTIDHFAIPNGKDEDFTEELRDFCKKKQFRSVLTTNHGTINTETDAFKLPRIHLPGPVFIFAGELARNLFLSK